MVFGLLTHNREGPRYFQTIEFLSEIRSISYCITPD